MSNTVPHMSNQMKTRVKNKLCSAASQDAIFQTLIVNPRKRISVDDLFSHRWVGGKSSEIDMGGVSDESSTTIDKSSGTKQDRDIILSEGKEEAVSKSSSSSSSTTMKKLPLKVGLGNQQEKLMRRSQSANDLKSMNLAKQLSKPPTPRRLPPLDGISTDTNAQHSDDNGNGDGNGDRSGSGSGRVHAKKRDLRVDAIMANKYDIKRKDSDAVKRIEEPLSPAISDAALIMDRGDAIFQMYSGGAKKQCEAEAEGSSREGKISDRGSGSPLAR